MVLVNQPPNHCHLSELSDLDSSQLLLHDISQTQECFLQFSSFLGFPLPSSPLKQWPEGLLQDGTSVQCCLTTYNRGLWKVSLRNKHLSRDLTKEYIWVLGVKYDMQIKRWRNGKTRRKDFRQGKQHSERPRQEETEPVHGKGSVERRSSTGCAREGRSQRPYWMKNSFVFWISRVIRYCEVEVGVIVAKLHFKITSLSTERRTD